MFLKVASFCYKLQLKLFLFYHLLSLMPVLGMTISYYHFKFQTSVKLTEKELFSVS